MKFNIADLVIILIIVIFLILAIREIIKRKGKCSYCSHAETCPFKIKQNSKE